MSDSTKYGGKRLRLSADEVEIINEHRGDNLDNINGNTALDIHLKDRGIFRCFIHFLFLYYRH